ncbi:MAG: protein-ADP-ribose hydrolase [Coriobacteriaceae bacterium]|nr:protein-ADP-ribose hydrolase [Coriobacteriaceae bacterium]
MEAMRKREMLKHLVSVLVDERARMMGQPMDLAIPEDIDGLWTLFRVLVNVRPPAPAMPAFLDMQDALLRGIAEEKGIANWQDAEVAPTRERMRLWRGDITALRVDAIVNAANSQMLGCWQPGHHCIDNAIHTFAGVELRMECADMMREQGREEPTGQAKITRAYNLPAKRIIHTVGPIANGKPTDEHRAQLAQCYRSCLDCAAENKLHSIAFCCISTGVFGFPQEEAARIAVRTVRAWLDAHEAADMNVVFNVFSPEDEALYRKELGF